MIDNFPIKNIFTYLGKRGEMLIGRMLVYEILKSGRIRPYDDLRTGKDLHDP